MPFLSTRALKGLQQYQYKSGGYTIFDQWHQPFWNGITNLLPTWLAPNLITLIGITGLIVAFLVTATMVPEIQGQAPVWVYLMNAAAVFSYMHLDCIDGKQARRTGSSSPLGQLFDHGCDALSVHYLLACVATSLSLGSGWQSVMGMLSIMGPWLLAHWEEYHTGTMTYGTSTWGLTEANYLVITLHLWTAFFGVGFWTSHPSQLLPFIQPYLPAAVQGIGPYLSWADFQFNHLVLIAMGGCSIQLASQQVWRVLVQGEGKLQPQEKGHKALGQEAAVSHAAQMAAFMGLGVWWLLEPMHHGPAQAHVMGGAFGLLYALEATKLVMDHMAKEPFEIFWWPLWLLGGLILNSKLHCINPALAAWLAATAAVAKYLQYVLSIIDQICQFLDINCLTIKHKTI
ncbi:hypothetical protein WJX74_003232 [Apatococcus lobatus]|uniref:Ethanolaminephosphotransferase n=3 Tax=Apatococcus TaxID=904362 RepID=A0AAW1SM40_9CHLO